MQNLKFTISIEKDSNKVVSSSEDKFVGIGTNSLIKLGSDNTLYTIIGREKYFYIQSFNCQDNKIITINEDIGINLQKSDTLKITYKEYEAKFITNILSVGIGYMSKDKPIVKGGIVDIDMSSGVSNPTTLEVIDTDNQGKILSLDIKNPGKYVKIPDNPVEVYGGRGNGLQCEIKYAESSNRTVVERTISDIYIRDNITYIVLDYSLPLTITSGKLSIEKNILILSSAYIGPTLKNSSYQIINNFTPNLKLPLKVTNTLSPELIDNKAFLMIDAEIAKIKKALNLD